MLNIKLRQSKNAWDVKTDYKRHALTEVLEYNKQYRLEHTTYPYNDAIKDYILEHEQIDADLIDMLKTEVYLSQKDIQDEKEEIYKNKMIADGWIPLNETAIDQALTEHKKLHVIASANNDWMTVKINEIFRPHIFNGKYGLMKPRAKTLGYSLSQFDNAYCKLV